MPRYTEKLFSEVSVQENILYATAPGYDQAHTETPLCLDVYSPAGDTKKNRRAIIFVHGGGFIKCDKQQSYIVTLCTVMAQYGYVCFSPDYRLFPVDHRPSLQEAACSTVQDVEAVRCFIQAHAEEYGIDPEEIAIGGGSAGGMATLEACKVYPCYFAYINLWGAYLNAAPADIYPPTLVIHGTADKLVPVEQGRAFFARLQEKGIPSQLVILQDAPHTAIQWLPEYEDTMVKFLDQHAQ